MEMRECGDGELRGTFQSSSKWMEVLLMQTNGSFSHASFLTSIWLHLIYIWNVTFSSFGWSATCSLLFKKKKNTVSIVYHSTRVSDVRPSGWFRALYRTVLTVPQGPTWPRTRRRDDVDCTLLPQPASLWLLCSSQPLQSVQRIGVADSGRVA